MTTGESLILYGLIGSGIAQIYSAFKAKRAELETKKLAVNLETSQTITRKHRDEVKSSLGTIQRSVNGALLAHQKTIWKMALRWANHTKLDEDYDVARFAETEYLNHKKQVESEKADEAAAVKANQKHEG